MSTIGTKTWVVAAGRIPFGTTGEEPEFTSRDEMAILNAGDSAAELEITIYFADREPVGPYRLSVPARRMRAVRFNDLIDPRALPLETHYSAVIRADRPVVVQFTRQDTRQAANALLGTIAYPA